MTKRIDILLSTALLLSGVTLFVLTFGEAFDAPGFIGDVGPAFVPRLILIGWIGFSMVSLYQSFHTSDDGREYRPLRFVLVALTVVGLAIAISGIGFLFASIPGFALFCWAFGYRNTWVLLISSLAVPVLIWALFTVALELLLPISPWFNMI